MPYYFSTKLKIGFDEAIEQVQDALKKEGFGVISEIDLQQAFKDKIGVDFRRYTILGACNPALAHQALTLEDKVGTMLPCNVIVQELEDGVEVAAVNPIASMQAIPNEQLAQKAEEVAIRLERVIHNISAAAPVVAHL